MTTYTLRKGAADKTRTDVVVVGVVTGPRGLEAAPGGEAVAAAYGRRFEPLLSTLGFHAKPGEIARVPSQGVIKAPLLILVGMGERAKLTAEGVRRAAGSAARAVANAASVTLALPAGDAEQVRAVVEGYALGAYTFDTYKTTKANGTAGEVVVLSDAARAKDAGAAVELAQVVAAAKSLARDWVNTPAADLTPALFADAVARANKARKGGKVSIEVLDEKQLAAGGYGGIIGVGQGSANPPRLVKLTYKPRGAKAHLALVGKGITYDSGGLSIKPGTSMTTMKSDMGGAAAVTTATFAIADLGLPVAVTTFVPMAENMVSGTATRPGDVLTMYGGKTVEVLNTDAEGRLILGDALVRAVESAPDLVVDVATLTGACETALGDRIAGVLGNDEDLVEQVLAAGRRTGEGLWPLPISPEMTEKVRTYSKVADLMQHNIDKFGGALYAAAFLQEFVGDTRWAHLDIAGPAFNGRAAFGHTPAGGTGFAVPTLVELARDLAG
ncbi:MAG: leucyl aminopeptidase [Nocardioidaceae bacterium]